MLTYYSDQNINFFEIKKCHKTIHAEKAHFHTELAVSIIENNGSYVTTDKQIEHKLTKNSFIIIPPYRTHNCIPFDKDKFKFTMIYIDSKWFEDIFRVSLNNNEIQLYQLGEKEVETVKKCFDILQSDISPIKKELILINFIEKYVLEKTNLILNNKNNSIENNKLEPIKKYLTQNYTEKISLDKLSEISNLSKYHLFRSFKAKYKLSPLNYQKSIKFNHAKKFLQNKNNNDISEIALDLGYYDQSHFTNDFKKFSGVSPNYYKKNTVNL